MKIDNLMQYGLGGEVRPNLTQDHVESKYGPSFSRLGPGSPYHARQGAKSNRNHDGTQARLHHRMRMRASPRTTLDIVV